MFVLEYKDFNTVSLKLQITLYKYQVTKSIQKGKTKILNKDKIKKDIWRHTKITEQYEPLDNQR